MEFPAVKELNSEELLGAQDYGPYFSGPFIYKMNCEGAEKSELINFINYLIQNKYILFPYGIICQFNKSQLNWLKELSKPTLMTVVTSKDQLDQAIVQFKRKRSKKSNGKTQVMELLVHQTWSQANDPLKQKLLKEISSWNREKNNLENENKIYEYIIKHLE